MPAPVEPTEAARTPAPDGDGDPAGALDTAVWTMSALIGTLRASLSAPLADVLASDPQRTAVLEHAGLLREDENGGGLVLHPAVAPADAAAARSAAEARLGSLRQAVAAAVSDPADDAETGWAAQPDETLLGQGRASAMTGRLLARKVVPRLRGAAERLGAEGSRVLDVGTGVGALAQALAQELPHTRVVGIDILERALDLARKELADAGPEVAARISLRRQDVVGLSDRAAYDLVWLPAPFVSEETLRAALPRLAEALVPGGWLVAGTNPAQDDALRRSVNRWIAVRNGGNAYDTARLTAELEQLGLEETESFPTVPGGPVLVAARRPPR